MPRKATTLDVFSAIGEPRRRDVLLTLLDGEHSVNHIVEALGWPQPQVSKHLGVLLEVGLVGVRRTGRQRLYRVNGQGLKTIHDWASRFEGFWQHQLDRIKARAEAKSGRSD
jgi:DNA-binding transcriptional ArsR family regulator